MNVKKQDCYNFIEIKIRENSEHRRKERAKLQKVIFEKRYSDIKFEKYGQELTSLAQQLTDLWEEFSTEALNKKDTDLESLGWGNLIRQSEERLSLVDNIAWFESKILDKSTVSEKKMDDLNDKHRNIEIELKQILRNLKMLPTGKKCKEYLEELGFNLPEVFTKPKNEIFAPINKNILGLPESK
ncbi:hypothetical protein [Vagococcus salmoninarum]|uniref:hypothetical protein n=1 Tax=Vagococcus salmoninarum TaxID=2739 RepID=UPI0018806E90|nr:hypothetical protein [Vagococcus salmoninarum]MBE9390140.1 hypothetical protein [Vagococcus salmoninarum]